MNVRPIKIGYVNGHQQIHDNQQAVFTSHLKHLFELDWVFSSSLQELHQKLSPQGGTGGTSEDAFSTINLIVFQARHVDNDSFSTWLARQFQTLQTTAKRQIPALILKEMTFAELAGIYLQAFQSNWYMDIMASAEISSLPIRIANLLRIYDHLRELRRYEETIAELQEKVTRLEKQVMGLHGSKS